MATNRKRIPRGRVCAGGITEVDYLYFSWGPFFDADDYEDGKTGEELKAFWTKHRTAIMDRYMSELRAKGPGWEGTRPDFFWAELTEPRLKTPPGEFSAQRVWDHQQECFDWVETDIEYLGRLGLLQPWEMEAKIADK